VQGLLSSQIHSGAAWHPIDVLQTAGMHRPPVLNDEQSIRGWVQFAAPAVTTQTSSVQAFPSSQLTGIASHAPVVALQVSGAQAFALAQTTGVNTHRYSPVALLVAQ